MENFGQMMPRECGCVLKSIDVIACNKREAFVQGSAAKQSSLSSRGKMDCFASLAMTRMGRVIAVRLFDS
jgi:hypothetical protein